MESEKVAAGGYCDLVALKFSLTFSQFVAMNSSIDSSYSNPELGVDYYVAAVKGTTVPVLTHDTISFGMDLII